MNKVLDKKITITNPPGIPAPIILGCEFHFTKINILYSVK